MSIVDSERHWLTCVDFKHMHVLKNEQFQISDSLLNMKIFWLYAMFLKKFLQAMMKLKIKAGSKCLMRLLDKRSFEKLQMVRFQKSVTWFILLKISSVLRINKQLAKDTASCWNLEQNLSPWIFAKSNLVQSAI